MVRDNILQILEGIAKFNPFSVIFSAFVYSKNSSLIFKSNTDNFFASDEKLQLNETETSLKRYLNSFVFEPATILKKVNILFINLRF